MKKYLFQLGHQKEISTAEIRAVFSQIDKQAKILPDNKADFLQVSTKKDIDMKELAKRLGGTVKILQYQMDVDEKNVLKKVSTYLKSNQKQGKIVFSLSGNKAKQKALGIKKILKAQGRSVRYIEPKSSATILHNQLVEKGSDITCLNNKIYTTCGLQDFVEFKQIDYDRPATDSQSGMLPPKLARILINLSQVNPDKNIYDPFCGSGTILMEAASLGFKNILGSDNSQKAIRDTNSNLEWLKDRNNLVFLDYKLFESDVRDIDKKVDLNSIDLVVTEPYLGKPLTGRESRKQLSDQARELEKLYTQGFKALYKVLKNGGIVIFIIPKFKLEDNWVKIDIIDKIKKLGFKQASFMKKKNLFYHRPDQHLGREIWMFTK